MLNENIAKFDTEYLQIVSSLDINMESRVCFIKFSFKKMINKIKSFWKKLYDKSEVFIFIKSIEIQLAMCSDKKTEKTSVSIFSKNSDLSCLLNKDLMVLPIDYESNKIKKVGEFSV